MATTLLSPVIADEMVPDPEKSTKQYDADAALWAAAVQSAANSGDVTGDGGLISQEDLEKASGRYSWIVQGADGRYRMDLSNADSDVYREVKEWTDSMNNTPNEDINEGLSDEFGGSYADGERRGSDIAEQVAR
ncbi:hypothetical protein NSA19_12840 [Actinomyces bowdenii]|nr:hypothetical protein [Actinomyces bowdenii]